MSRSSTSFNRGKARYRTQPTVLVICEDSKSCLQYLKDAARHFRAYADVDIAHCGKTDPRGIVEAAIKRSKDFDIVYCAIDRDRHETFDEALELAKAHSPKVSVIVSYPCYEFWLMLHFKKTRKPYRETATHSPGDLMVKDLRAIDDMDTYEKGQSEQLFGKLLPRLQDARVRADQVFAEALGENEMNPSTTLHRLIAKFESLGAIEILA
ncbi:MAG: RloB family protein [Proteobacteria bacterium]|nr:RloB family protein [Pseudomonadota bacterium]